MRAAISGLLLAVAGGAWGQTDASGPAFEVASVKVSPPPPNGVMMFRVGGLRDTADPSRVNYQHVTLKALVAHAYGVKDYQVEGPQWLDSEQYDVMATLPEGAGKDQVPLMLQRLLAERFHLTLHKESKPLNVYTLSVAKGGPKLKEVDPGKLPPAPAPGSAPPLPPPPPPPGGGLMPRGGPMPAGAMRMMMTPNGRQLTGNITIERLCTMLTNFMDRPVIDLTELKGTYEFDLAWSPNEAEKMGGGMGPAMIMAGPPPPSAAAGQPGSDNGANDPGQPLAQVLQANYGLKLEAKKNPADILVIDRAEKVPTEN
jgi:uncharacterized protein (TIGR03435 family)